MDKIIASSTKKIIICVSLLILFLFSAYASAISTKDIQKSEKLYNEGYKLYRDFDYPATVKKMNAAIKLDPKSYKAYNVKGIALCFDGNFKEGMKNIDYSIQLKSNYDYSRFNKALAYELYHSYDKAIIWYKKALEIKKDPWSYYGIASIFGRKGDAVNTAKYLKLAKAIVPSIMKYADDEKDFNKVRNSKEYKALKK